MNAKWGKLLGWIVLCFLLMGNDTTNRDPVIEIVNQYRNTGSTPTLFVLHHGGRINRALTSREVEELAKRINYEFYGKNIQRFVEGDGIRYQSESQVSSSLKISIRIVDDQPTQTRKKPYVSLELKGNGIPDHRLQQFQKQFEQICLANEMMPNIHFSLQGEVNAEQISKMKNLIQSYVKPLAAKQIEEMTTENTVSISYFVPRWGSGIITKGGEMNLQVATRWNHQTNRVILTMGTPIITIEY